MLIASVGLTSLFSVALFGLLVLFGVARFLWFAGFLVCVVWVWLLAICWWICVWFLVDFMLVVF